MKQQSSLLHTALLLLVATSIFMVSQMIVQQGRQIGRLTGQVSALQHKIAASTFEGGDADTKITYFMPCTENPESQDFSLHARTREGDDQVIIDDIRPLIGQEESHCLEQIASGFSVYFQPVLFGDAGPPREIYSFSTASKTFKRLRATLPFRAQISPHDPYIVGLGPKDKNGEVRALIFVDLENDRTIEIGKLDTTHSYTKYLPFSELGDIESAYPEADISWNWGMITARVFSTTDPLSTCDFEGACRLRLPVYELEFSAWHESRNYVPVETTPPLSWDILRNATYDIGEEAPVKFIDGRYDLPVRLKGESQFDWFIEIQKAPMAIGDLNGDGQKDTALLFGSRAGGSGYFVKLAAVINADGKPRHVGSFDLGDRAHVESLRIENQNIIVQFIPWEKDASPQEQTFTLTNTGLIRI